MTGYHFFTGNDCLTLLFIAKFLWLPHFPNISRKTLLPERMQLLIMLTKPFQLSFIDITSVGNVFS